MSKESVSWGPTDARCEYTLRELERTATNAVLRFKNVSQVLPAHPVDIVYHYTDLAGLLGIVRSGELWLTDATQLNDPTELRHGLSYALEVMKSWFPYDRTDQYYVFVNRFSRFVDELSVDTGIHFVASFSANGDDLNQWRGYAAQGKGFALGFDARILAEGFTKFDSDSSAFAAIYRDVEMRFVLQPVIGEILQAAWLAGTTRSQEMACPSWYWDGMFKIASQALLRLSIPFKNEAYSTEEEYRLLRMSTRGSNVRSRSRSGGMIHYEAFDWRAACPASLVRIVSGPAANLEELDQLTEIVATLPFTPKISRSNIPFRSV
ncbi:MAG: DUF2971 domain-containing protein [Polaromonas sp.]|nr:DUF2971 domain-containing protein [Polaromonas sp.]